MTEPGGDPDFLQEPLAAERLGQLGAEHLDRDRAVVPEVPAKVDGRHPPATQLALDHIQFGERSLQAGRLLSQGTPPGGAGKIPR